MSISYLNPKDFDTIEFVPEQSSLHVTASELSHFADDKRTLSEKIGKRKLQYTKDNGYTTEIANDNLEKDCMIAVDTMRKTILGTTKPTRNFLYKFTVGLHMSVDEANEFFELCDGPLNEKCMADYICIRALEDGDSIEKFVKEFEQHVEIKLVKKSRKEKKS